MGPVSDTLLLDRHKESGSAPCPECGAPRVDGLTCWEQLGAIIAWEWQDPALLAQHFLTVASYNLQHPAQFTDEVILGLRRFFIEHLDQGIAVTEIRRSVSRMTEGKVRVLKPEAERRSQLQHWRMTIADVYIPDQPAGAATRVQAWAASIRAEVNNLTLPLFTMLDAGAGPAPLLHPLP